MEANQSQISPNPETSRFEGFFLQMVTPGLENECREIVEKVLGADWQVKSIGDNSTEFEISLRDDALSSKDAWDKSYNMRSQPGVIDAEPLFAVPVADIKPDLDLSRELFSDEIAKESGDVTWGLQQMRVLDVWQKYFPDPNKLPGHGIVIGHPDTGYTQHPEVINNLLLDKGFNYIKRTKDPLDTLETSGGEIINNPGHGTSTASLIISPPGAQGNYANGKYVTGVAPGAKVLPLRVTYSVVLLSTRSLAEAIEYATDNGCHVITISLGTGLPNRRLRSAILYAQKRGVIIVAASGTMIPYVVYPAAYDEVIAVTGSNIRREIWGGASRGKKVDVTAPGQALWHAKTRKENGELTYNIEQDSGTSFSAPLVAGVAALWLSYHGRDQLIERYGAENIPSIFNQLLRDSCEKFPTWKPNKFGAGIVNAEKLLATPLPDNVNNSFISSALALQQHSPVDSGEIETFEHLFESQIPTSNSISKMSKLNSSLAQLLQTDENHLPEKLKQVGKELAFHFATNPELYQEFVSALQDEEETVAQGLLGTQLESPGNKSLSNILLQQGVSNVLHDQLSREN
ncbi:S8 family peptidase [Calothrix sp. PCC 6303]|uniref:S8 family peptidase n=1 Tax=Calothrix sp. PCC 6303 TaxID=1170562 RepID=UPI0002A0132C|nr:S8/S53 family peptidase [Calothrix sp. PCC 6303]AFZ02099.1 peptidase S8 and S53 subtilisin kexin sedolisin [Calothrix sp. PCC 6303]